MILFDTDVCIEILRGNKNVIKKRKEYEGDIAISFMTVAELYYGAEKSNNIEHNSTVIEKFLLSVDIIDSDVEILKKFGKIKARLYKDKNIISDANIFIASVALTKCDKLISGNLSHFKRIEELNVENWIR
jgi:tRNA(fMet)-specific endonuclease VapC